MMEAFEKANTSEYYNILITPSMDMFLPAMVTMLSAMKNAGRPCHFYIMQSDFGEENKEAYRKLIGDYPENQIEFIDMNDEDFQIFKPWHGRYSNYYPLSAPEKLPESVDRVLYLDCDLYVKKDLSEYYDMDFEENLIIGSNEIILREAYEREIQNGLEKRGHLNTGVLLYNLEGFRRAGITLDYYVPFIKEWNGDYFLDQGLQSYVFDGKIKLLPCYKYNHRMALYSTDRLTRSDAVATTPILERMFSLSPEEKRESLTKPYHDERYNEQQSATIVHFSGWNIAKPWMSVPQIDSSGITGIAEISYLEKTRGIRSYVEKFYLEWWQIASELPKEYFWQLLVVNGERSRRIALRGVQEALGWTRNALSFCSALNQDFLETRKFSRFVQSLKGKSVFILKSGDTAGQIFLKACESTGANVITNPKKAGLNELTAEELEECKKADVVVSCCVHGTKTHERDGVKCIDIWDILRDDSLTKDPPAVPEASSETLAAIANEARRAKEICENIEKLAQN